MVYLNRVYSGFVKQPMYEKISLYNPMFIAAFKFN